MIFPDTEPIAPRLFQSATRPINSFLTTAAGEWLQVPRRGSSPMSRLPTWAAWSIGLPLVLLSPVIALLLAIAVEIAIVAVFDDGAPLLVVLGAGAGCFCFTGCGCPLPSSRRTPNPAFGD